MKNEKADASATKPPSGELTPSVLVKFQLYVRAAIDFDEQYDAGLTGDAAEKAFPAILEKVADFTPPELKGFLNHPQVKQLIIARLSFPKRQRGS